MSRLGVYDNWGRLVAAVIDREKLQQLAFCDSFSSTSSSAASLSLSRLSSVSSTFDDFGAFGNDLDQATGPSSSTRASTRINGRGGVAAFLFAGPLAYYRRKKLREYDLFVSKFFFDVPAHQLDQLERFSLGELKLATDNFSNQNIIGRGGFGKVYKGRLADGSLVAVKMKKEERRQGYDLQFRAEIKVKINTGEHPNILQLRGFCLTSTEGILVYPYMANRTLASCLRERTESQPPLDWPTRERIALSSAKGLAYLHDQCHKKVIHRDVKAANILLNEDFEAVIGDFGLAEFMDPDDTHLSTDDEAAVIFDFGLAILMDADDTHVTTAVRGTIGHIAPEYLATGTVSEKVDVFAFGILLLELITGQRAYDLARLANDDDVMLLNWVKGLFKEDKLEALVDADLPGNYIDDKVGEFIQVALLCCRGSPEKRPKMSDVFQMLQGDDHSFAKRWYDYCQEEEILPHQSNNYRYYHLDTDMSTESSTSSSSTSDSVGGEELSGPR